MTVPKVVKRFPGNEGVHKHVESKMGLLDKIKGWLNIGGVKVKLDVAPQVSRSQSELPGKVTLTTKDDKHVLKLNYKLIEERTTGSDDEEETEETILGQVTMSEPFDIKGGETRELDFVIGYAIKERLADKKGMMGAVGKLGSFAAGEELKYYVVAECDVKGTALDPSDKREVQVVE